MRRTILPAILPLLAALSPLFAADPPSSVKLTVPDYRVAKLGELDLVTIPDGTVLTSEEGRPQVPYFVRILDYPEGYRILDVTMKSRSEPRTDSGLRLPVVQFDTAPLKPSAIKQDVYPTKDFEWKVWYSQDRTAKLTIAAYPFIYDPKTTRVRFHKDYEFDIRLVQTSVRISRVATDSAVYDPGEAVAIRAWLENSGGSQDITAELRILKAFTDEPVLFLPPKKLALGLADSVSFTWNSHDPGDYEAEIKVLDKDGNELGRELVLVRLGLPAGEVTDFDATPSHFKVGDRIQLSLGFRNTGTCDLAGECVFWIVHQGQVLEELKEPFASLKPKSSRKFQQTWSTTQAEKAAVYYAVGFVRHQGGSSEGGSIMVSTNLMPEASFSFAPETVAVGQEVRFDASGSRDADGSVTEWRWEFGDGADATGSISVHVYFDPGEYLVGLTVKDNDGGESIAEQTVAVLKP